MANCEMKMYEELCKRRFDAIEGKLDKCIESISGNGKPGIIQRLRELESAKVEIKGIVDFIVKKWHVVLIIILLFVSLAKEGKMCPDQIKEIVQQAKDLGVP